MKRILRIVMAALVLLLVAPASWAGTEFNLQDRNAAVDFSPGGILWFVEGEPWVGQNFSLFLEDEEILIPAVEPDAFQFTDTNSFVDPADDTLALRYGSEGELLLDITITLRGGPDGSNVSDLAETIIITNDLEFDLFFVQRVFLGFPEPDGDIVNDNTIRITGSGGLEFEEVVTPAWEVFDEGGGKGEVGFELGWSIAPGETLLISKDKRVFVPEPSTATLFGLGIVALAAARRR